MPGSLFRTQRIDGMPGASGYVRTTVVDAGELDVSDGELWQAGGEYLPSPDSGRSLAVPPGHPGVRLLVAMPSDLRRFGWGVAAVEVRIGAGTPVRWVQTRALAGITDAGELALGGDAAVRKLAAIRDFDSAIDEIEGSSWYTPCQALTRDGAGPAADALLVELTGDGGWPGAVAYDAAGRPVDAVLSAGVLPWALLGLPGKPPPEAVAVEPSATATAG